MPAGSSLLRNIKDPPIWLTALLPQDGVNLKAENEGLALDEHVALPGKAKAWWVGVGAKGSAFGVSAAIGEELTIL